MNFPWIKKTLVWLSPLAPALRNNRLKPCRCGNWPFVMSQKALIHTPVSSFYLCPVVHMEGPSRHRVPKPPEPSTFLEGVSKTCQSGLNMLFSFAFSQLAGCEQWSVNLKRKVSYGTFEKLFLSACLGGAINIKHPYSSSLMFRSVQKYARVCRHTCEKALMVTSNPILKRSPTPAPAPALSRKLEKKKKRKKKRKSNLGSEQLAVLLGPLLGFDLPQTSQVVQLFSQAVGIPQKLLDGPVLLLLLVPLQRVQQLDGHQHIGHWVLVGEIEATGYNMKSPKPLKWTTFGLFLSPGLLTGESETVH